ncbi:5'-methylthioadenosine/adenosylhomocysteine nucleosidase [Suttonella sp. R2A3]|uniref:5'-methylthioadenosine/adenosylhomocysteine nucleosidase n=1 Tax=Suttonella sp. R2A3 TaxID=2908648 RepID=UPI001F35D1D8|nr:5'-methylthioadenosine/adenosylhomocysteine nucleosidase [Suttonella sp. R2A3]UJF24016.1 5'-methylthioadenosine/adenosylhomocysteine nucleosidase [Suttonella sp. R2A3]
MSAQPIAIIGAMEQEVALLAAELKKAKQETIAGITIHSGKLNDVSVVIMQCGIGKVNAAIGTTILIERYQPKAIINTGSAGGIQPQLQVGDVVVAKQTLHHDVDVQAFGYAPGQMAQMPETYTSDASLNQKASIAAGVFSSIVHQGTIASGDQFIHGGEALARIKETFPDVLAIDMEAAAIAQTCYRYDVPFSVIRAISDNASEEASQSFEVFLEHAAKQSAKMVAAIALTA